MKKENIDNKLTKTQNETENLTDNSQDSEQTENKKLTKKQIVKMCVCIFGAVCILLATAFAIASAHLPDSVSMLSLPLYFVALAIFLVLRTMQRPHVQVMPPPEIEDENSENDEANIDNNGEENSENIEETEKDLEDLEDKNEK